MIPLTLEAFQKIADNTEAFGAYIDNTRILLSKEAVLEWAKESVMIGREPLILIGASGYLSKNVIVLGSSNPSHKLVRVSELSQILSQNHYLLTQNHGGAQ